VGDLDEIKRDMRTAKNQLEAVKNLLEAVKTHVQALAGTFASIERHLVKLFEWKVQVDSRLDALEGGKPPAA